MPAVQTPTSPQRAEAAYNKRMNAPHSVVTTLANGGKRRAAGRARYAHRCPDDKKGSVS
jgi:hypothetical protein